MSTEIDPGFIRNLYLFASLEEAHLAEILRTVSVIHLNEGQLLFEQDSAAHHFYAVHSGQAKLFRLSSQGGEKIYEIIGPGKTFAEAILFMDRKTYPVGCQALVPTVVYAFPHNTFFEILRDSTAASFRLLGDISMRLRRLIMEVDQLTLQNATMRLINFLQHELPSSGPAELDIELNIPKSILASRLSIQPETFSRILKKLKGEGLIDVNGKTIHVKDVEQLRDFSNLH